MQSSTFAAADGAGYERQMGRWSRRLAGPFLEFVGTAEAETVLDVGCGTGALASAIVEQSRATRVHGIDFSPVYVEHARRHTSSPRITFEVGDACAYDARQIGNLKDNDDPLARIIMNERVAILKDEYGTKPQVFYIGLDHTVR